MTSPQEPILPIGDGHTPLGDDDRSGLKLSYITTRGELNEAEQDNILRARRALRVPTVNTLLDDRYLRQLHKVMFGDVWQWAGQYRQREMSIGIDPSQIATSVRDLVSDAKLWVVHEAPRRVAARFHHRLVWIHPFTNGITSRSTRWRLH